MRRTGRVVVASVSVALVAFVAYQLHECINRDLRYDDQRAADDLVRNWPHELRVPRGIEVPHATHGEALDPRRLDVIVDAQQVLVHGRAFAFASPEHEDAIRSALEWAREARESRDAGFDKTVASVNLLVDGRTSYAVAASVLLAIDEQGMDARVVVRAPDGGLNTLTLHLGSSTSACVLDTDLDATWDASCWSRDAMDASPSDSAGIQMQQLMLEAVRVPLLMPRPSTPFQDVVSSLDAAERFGGVTLGAPRETHR